MAKMRVYELANSLGIEVERAIRLLQQVGASPRNHMSVVERVPARRVRQLLKQNKNAALPETQLQQVEPVIVAPPPGEAVAETDGAAKKAADPPREKATASAPAPAAQDKTPAKDDAQAPAEPERKEEAPAAELSATGAAEPKALDAPAAAKSTASAEASPKVTPLPSSEQETKPAGSASEAPAKSAASRQRADADKDKESTRVAKPAGEAAASAAPQREQAPGADMPVEKKQPKAAAQPAAASRSTPRPTAKAAAAKPAPASARRTAAVEVDQDDDVPRSKGRPDARRGGKADKAEAPAGGRRQRKRAAAKAQTDRRAPARPTGPVEIPDSLTVNELAELLGIPATTIIMKLMEAGVMAAINQSIEFEVAARVAEKLGYEVTRPEKPTIGVGRLDDDEENLKPRPPVVTIMGHVDHGKTTLLDAIRQTKVAEQEAGGITQHIGAYQVESNGQKITFLDTPGHEAFTAMRSRGAQVTDIAVLVVAADDGVMPQTVEAINHAKAADVPIIVAINKIDRPGANSERIKQQLVDHGLIPEEWGGDTVCVEVSALQGEGIDELLEMILLVAELRELKANPDRPAVGVVIDAQLDKARGPVATVLVQAGTLRVGDNIVAGSVYGRVRAMHDEHGSTVDEAGPSRPVEVLGLGDVPKAGDLVEVVADERTARQMAEERAAKERDESQRAGRIRLSEIYSKSQAGEVKDLNLLIKADVQGSVEALRQSVEKIKSDEVRINVIHAAVGGITESDVALAAASDAVIIGFNVRPESAARRAADREDVEIRLYRVIYEAIEDIEAAIEGMLEPTYEEVVLGRAEVRATFRVPNVGVVAGCYVTEGRIVRQAEARLIRDHVVIHEGKLASLKRFKDDVREVQEGYECGIGFERFQDIKEGDIIEAFRMEEVKKG